MITEESFLDFKCPYCGEPVSFPQDCAGFAQECVSCLESLIVPEAGNEIGLKPPIPITTPRLVLRRLTGSDWKDLLELFSDEEMFLYDEGNPLEEEQILRWLESDAAVKLTTPGQPFYLGIQTQDSGKFIGLLTLSFTEPQRRQARLAISLNRDYRRKGFGLEAMTAILRFCFEGIKLHRVTAICDTRNTPARELCEKVGLRREGEFVKDRLVRGEWMSSVWYAALDEEYRGAAGDSAEGSSADPVSK